MTNNSNTYNGILELCDFYEEYHLLPTSRAINAAIGDCCGATVMEVVRQLERSHDALTGIYSATERIMNSPLSTLSEEEARRILARLEDYALDLKFQSDDLKGFIEDLLENEREESY
ncbi:hypothetical protein GAQ89_001706 [Escherichia coli]|nr:hypothetical protein [Escherichia coli]